MISLVWKSFGFMFALRDRRLTACVTGAGVGVDSAWEQNKLEARKMLEKAADSPTSSARGVSPFLIVIYLINKLTRKFIATDEITPRINPKTQSRYFPFLVTSSFVTRVA